MILDLPGESEQVGRSSLGEEGEDSLLEIWVPFFIFGMDPVWVVGISAGVTFIGGESAIPLMQKHL